MVRYACLGSLLLVAVVRADERTFSVTVDGKPAGEIKIVTRAIEGRTTEIRWQYDLSGMKLLSLAYDGTEKWQDGQLLLLEGTGSENSRKKSVSLVRGKGGYTLKAGVKEATVRGDVWPTTFWVRPDAEKPLLVDALTGEVSRVKIEPVGPDRTSVDGKVIKVVKYRLTAAGAVTELWYDSANLLTRRRWERNGQSIVMELVHIKTE